MKHFLKQVFEFDKQISYLCEQIAELRTRQMGAGGGGDGLGVQTTRNLTAMEDVTVKILMLEERLARIKARLLAHEGRVRCMALPLSTIPRAIITWRYICRLTWHEVASRAGISEVQAMREHNAALAAMENAEIHALSCQRSESMIG